MAAVAALLGGRKGFKSGRVIRVYFTVTPSGDYATGGDTLNLSGLVPGTKAPIYVHIEGIGGFTYRYVKGTNIADGKFMVRVNDAGGANAPEAQHTAAGYAAGVTADVITGYADFDAIQ
jgi:hypothetical protein